MNAALERMMDFDLTEEQRLVRRTVREFAEAEILPHLEKYEKQERYPTELVDLLPDLGLMGPMIPEEYGGSYADVMTYGVIMEELARVDWVIASVVSVANSLVAGSILKHGTDEQKQNFLPGIASGEIICSACLTEPRGGTDLANMETTAKPSTAASSERHEGLHLARPACGPLLHRRFDRPRQEHKGVTAFIADPREMKGLTIGEFPMRTLKRDNLAEFRFEDVFVPDEAVLGTPGGGFPILGGALDMGRFSVAARCVGQAQRAIDLTAPYAMDREAFGQPIGEFQLVQAKLAEMVARTEQARQLVYRLGRMKDAGVERCSLESSLAKWKASVAATQNALDGMAVFGGYSVTAEYEIGRLLMEAKALEFGEGTSDLHTKMVAEYALGIRKL